MNQAERAGRELRAMDDLAAQDSFLHRLSPLSKLFVTIFYLAVVVSFPRYRLTALVWMALFPVAGLVGMFFARSMPAVIVTGCVMMSGYMLVTAILSGVIRDHTPAGKAGHFQGIRMIFGVLLPMILGPAIGAAVIRGSDSTYVDLGVVKTVPTPSIFLAAAVVLLLILPPVLALRKKEGAAC